MLQSERSHKILIALPNERQLLPSLSSQTRYHHPETEHLQGLNNPEEKQNNILFTLLAKASNPHNHHQKPVFCYLSMFLSLICKDYLITFSLTLLIKNER